tara:strand:+ start:623 stop:988 length:366 start_codon:yes stop_codon:yes gene_type:complete
MATLTPSLTLTSTDYGSDSLSFTVTDNLSVTPPTTGVSRQSIATGSAQDVLASNSAFSYIFIRNASSSNAAAFLQIKLGGNAVIRLDVEEFAFIPIYSGLTVQAEAYTAACVLEFARFSKA